MSQYQLAIRRNQALGDKLIWRNPWDTEAGQRLLAGLPERNSITIGYYRQLPDPPGAWAFMPVTSEAVSRALELPALQRRIARDLQQRIEQSLEAAHG